LPLFTAKTGIEVRVVAVAPDRRSTSAAAATRRGVGARQALEEKFIAEGHGVKRYDVMYNDFVLIGPSPIRARRRRKDVLAAFRKVKEAGAPFVSRGDKSARIRRARDLAPRGHRYRARQGRLVPRHRARHGPALNTAAR